jgi:hypothetical protein
MMLRFYERRAIGLLHNPPKLARLVVGELPSTG